MIFSWISRGLSLCVLGRNPCKAGYAVMLTNDSSYWKVPGRSDTVDADFRVHEGREISGALAWAARTGPGTMKGRESPIRLQGSIVYAGKSIQLSREVVRQIPISCGFSGVTNRGTSSRSLTMAHCMSRDIE